MVGSISLPVLTILTIFTIIILPFIDPDRMLIQTFGRPFTLVIAINIGIIVAYIYTKITTKLNNHYEGMFNLNKNENNTN